MNFDMTEEQQMLADTTRDVLSGYDTEKRNTVVESDQGYSPQVWQQLAEIGILGLGFDEDSGPIEVLAVMTEVGRRLAPEPVAAAALIPGGVIAEHGSAEQRALLALFRSLARSLSLLLSLSHSLSLTLSLTHTHSGRVRAGGAAWRR